MNKTNEALIAAFQAAGGPPSEWRFSGRVVDLGAPVGECACGHVIRFEYYWERPGSDREVVTGSVCVENVPGLPDDQIEAVKNYSRRKREDEYQDARREAWEVWKRIFWPFQQPRSAWEREVYRAGNTFMERLRGTAALKTTGGRLRRLRKIIVEMAEYEVERESRVRAMSYLETVSYCFSGYGIQAKYPGTCLVCGEEFPTGSGIFWLTDFREKSKIGAIPHSKCELSPISEKIVNLILKKEPTDGSER